MLTKSVAPDAGRIPLPTLAGELASIDALIAKYRDEPGGLMPLLHAIQEALGYVPADAVGPLARALNQ